MPRWPAALGRFDSVFGAPPEVMGEEHIRRLVADDVRESEDLDFKRALYDRGEKAKIALASDVAAMANDRGGVIVLGVHENDDETAAALTPVSVDGEHLRWMREVIARHTAPHVSTDLVTVASEDDPSVGWVLIVVPPSDRRPHAVVKGDDLRYSRRHGTTTRHLGEAEVADLYRDRFATGAAQGDRARVLMGEGTAVLPGDQATVRMALLPTSPGRMALDGDRLRRIADWINDTTGEEIGTARLWLGYFRSQADVSVGHRRVIASHRASERRVQAPYVELHTDGAGFAGYPLHDLRGRQHAAAPGPWLPLPGDLSFAIARMLRLLGLHARDHTGAVGDALLLVRLASDRPITFGYRDPAGFAETWDRVPVREQPIEAEFTVTVDALAGDDTALLAAASMVSSDLLQAFGIPDDRIFTRTGAFRARWAPREERQWYGQGDATPESFALARGVVIDDSNPAPVE